MLDLGLSIIDRLIELVKGRVEARKSVFGQVIDPIYLDMALIHADYLDLFSNARQSLAITVRDRDRVATPQDLQELESKKLGQCIEILEKARRRLEPLRVKAQAFVETLKTVKVHEEEKALLNAVSVYLLDCDFPHQGRFSAPMPFTPSRKVIENLRRFRSESGYNGPYSPERYLENQIDELRNKWSDLSVAYARAKLAIASLR